MSNTACVEDKQRPINTLPLLVLNEDQESSNFCASWFLRNHLNLRMMCVEDPWHRVWNDVLRAAKKAGYYGTILLTGICHNLSYGPWNGTKWFHEIYEASLDLSRLGLDGDPVIEKFCQRILKDEGKPGCLAYAPGGMEAVRQSILDATFLRVKGPRTATSRWFSWMDAMEWWSPQWSKRLVILLYIGLQMGYVTQDDTNLVVQALTSGGSAPSGQDKATTCGDHKEAAQAGGSAPSTDAAPMRKNKADMQQLRDRCKKSLHVALMIHANDKHISQARALLYAARSLRAWYGHWSSELRSREACLKFHIGMAHGSVALPSVAALSRPFEDLASLEQLGFLVEPLRAVVQKCAAWGLELECSEHSGTVFLFVCWFL